MHSERDVQALSDWLIEQGLKGGAIETVFESFCTRLVDIGVPLWRVRIGMRVLHPTYGTHTFTWVSGKRVESDPQLYRRDHLPEWRDSPFHMMLRRNQASGRWDLLNNDPAHEFALLDRLADEGATDYLAEIVDFSDDGVIDGRKGMVASYCSRDREGFSDRDVEIISRLNKRLALTVKALLNIDIARNIVDTYIGHEAGRRVLSGDIHPGFHENIRAVIYFADIKNFTGLSEKLPPHELVALLDIYLERMISPVLEAGGHVLKFMGDGVLASFNLADRNAEAVANTALQAAVRSLQLMGETNAMRRASDELAITFDVALHVGEVLYGNVGAKDRLDFTVIGPTVNEVSRIEKFCDEMSVHLIISDAFAESLGPSGRLKTLGSHKLRGSQRPRELFSLDDPAVMAK